MNVWIVVAYIDYEGDDLASARVFTSKEAAHKYGKTLKKDEYDFSGYAINELKLDDASELPKFYFDDADVDYISFRGDK